jgi:hypothetical protein
MVSSFYRKFGVSMTIKVNLDPSLLLRMTHWVRLVILRTEVACPEPAEGKNLGFGFEIWNR